MHIVRIVLRLACAGALAVCAGTLLAPSAGAAEDNVDVEFEYAAKLIELELPDYADLVMGAVLAKRPELKDRVEVVKAQALVSLRRFPEVEALIARMPKDSPKTQAIKLALADGYFQASQQDKCNALYQQFFGQYTNRVPDDPDLLRFYQTAAHKYAQMLQMRKNPKAAADIYELLLKTIQDRDTSRQFRLEQAELYLQAITSGPVPLKEAEQAEILKKAEAGCNEVIWGGMDIWFGRAVTVLAQMLLVQKRKDDAVDLLQDNLPILKKLDEALEEAKIPMSESPYAGVRSLLGQLNEEDAALRLGPADKRQDEALRYLELAFAELQAVWDIIAKISARDQTIAKRDGNNQGLQGTPATRQEPFQALQTELRAFDEKIKTAAGAEGWVPGVSARLKALQEKIAKLTETAQQYPKDIGVTATSEMKIDENFKGRALVEKAMPYLADAEKRKKDGIELYTKALQHYYNVFSGYPDTHWSAEASGKVQALKTKLKDLTGQEVTIEAKKGGKKKIGLVMLKEGRDLFARKEYAKAVEQFVQGLNQYPDGDESLVALANLMECYVNLKDTLHVKMLANYIGERFWSQPDAPQGLLRAGRLYFDAANPELYKFVYEAYLKYFPKHTGAAGILYTLGEQHWKANDFIGAVPYYERVVKGYRGGPYFFKALDRIGWSHYMAKDYAKAADSFLRLVQEARPSLDRARGKLCLADSLRQLGQYDKALEHYRELTTWLEDKNSVYAAVELVKQSGEILQQSVFFQAYCYSRMDKPADKAPEYRKNAVAQYQGFVARFPQSELAPTALSSMGAVLMADGKAQEASQAYDDLAKKYPTSEAGQNARFAMVRSLMDIGRTEKAVEVVKEMLANAKSYPPDNFTKIGLMLAEADQSEAAADALEQARTMLKQNPQTTKEYTDLEQRTLYGLGRAELGRKRVDEAIVVLNELIEKYPNSGLFYEARFYLGQAYKEKGAPDQAIQILTDVFKRASDQTLITRATLELASLQVAAGDKKEALASYQRVVLLGNPDDAATRPLYDDALAGSIRIFGEDARWKDVLESADKYLVVFPAGRNLPDVRNWRAKAVTQTTLEGGQKP